MIKLPELMKWRTIMKSIEQGKNIMRPSLISTFLIPRNHGLTRLFGLFICSVKRGMKIPNMDGISMEDIRKATKAGGSLLIQNNNDKKSKL